MENSEPTLSETLKKLRAEGYTEDFNLKSDCIDCRMGQIKIYPKDFHIDKFFRFEGQSDPSDSAILYAISSEQFQLKGVLVNAYSIYSESITNDLLDKLKAN